MTEQAPGTGTAATLPNDPMEALRVLADKFDEAAGGARKHAVRHIPGWVRWAVAAGITLLAVVGLVVVWNMVFGGNEVEAAKHAEKLHQALMRYVVAFVVAIASTALALVLLTLALDFMTARREFLAKVEADEASDLAMAVFSVGTAIYAAGVFIATLSALSI